MPVNRRIIKALPDVVGTTVQAVSIPVGTVIGWDSDDPIPTGFIEANGATFDPIRYPALAAVYEDNKTPYRSDIPRYATIVERDAAVGVVVDGAQCITLDTMTRWLRRSGAWYVMDGTGLGVVRAIGNYGGTDTTITTTLTTIPINGQLLRNCSIVGGNSVHVTQSGDYFQASTFQIFSSATPAGAIEIRFSVSRASSIISEFIVTHSIAASTQWTTITVEKYWWALNANDEILYRVSGSQTGYVLTGSRGNWLVERLGSMDLV